MQDLNESIAVLQAKLEGRAIECQAIDKKDAEWARISATHPFNFGAYRYRVVVFPEITYALFSLDTGKLHPEPFTNPADALAHKIEMQNDENWHLVRLVECGQADESRPRAAQPMADAT